MVTLEFERSQEDIGFKMMCFFFVPKYIFLKLIKIVCSYSIEQKFLTDYMFKRSLFELTQFLVL